MSLTTTDRANTNHPSPNDARQIVSIDPTQTHPSPVRLTGACGPPRSRAKAYWSRRLRRRKRTHCDVVVVVVVVSFRYFIYPTAVDRSDGVGCVCICGYVCHVYVYGCYVYAHTRARSAAYHTLIGAVALKGASAGAKAAMRSSLGRGSARPETHTCTSSPVLVFGVLCWCRWVFGGSRAMSKDNDGRIEPHTAHARTRRLERPRRSRHAHGGVQRPLLDAVVRVLLIRVPLGAWCSGGGRTYTRAPQCRAAAHPHPHPKHQSTCRPPTHQSIKNRHRPTPTPTETHRHAPGAPLDRRC